MKDSSGPGLKTVYIAYYLTLAAMLAASFWPDHRIWGLNFWAYYPLWVPLSLFGVGALLPVILSRPSLDPDRRRAASGDKEPSAMKFLVWSVVIFAAFLGAFYFLRARTHFLGDGYTLLSNLAEGSPIFKIRNFGAMTINKLLFSVMSGQPDGRALSAFRAVSFISGSAFLAVALASARALFDGTKDRLLFSMGLLSGGYMLLFFGYVEHYSLFIPAVGLFGVTGLLIVQRGVNRWYILAPLGLSLFLHIFGVTLLPAAAYILAAGSPIGTAWLRVRKTMKVVIVISLMVILAAVFIYYYKTHYFFRFALVPLVSNRFTVEGYTLFSAAHVLDVLNLCFQLLPSLMLFVVATFFLPFRAIVARRETIFLIIMAVSGLGVVVLFDPKLGMPRDWDLFAFTGVPMALLGYYTIIKSRRPSGSSSKVAVLAIILGVSVLLPRAVGRTRGDIELSHISNYTRLDTKKNVNLYRVIQDYYVERGQKARADACYREWERNSPEYLLNRQGLDAKTAGRFAEASALFNRAIKENPMFTPSYHNLGSCYLSMGRYEDALEALTISDGLNPNSLYNLEMLGQLHTTLGNMEAAGEYLRRALAADTNRMSTQLSLLVFYAKSGDRVKYERLLIELASRADAPATVHKTLGDHYWARGATNQAEAQYRQAIAKGLDPTRLQTVLERFPHLGSEAGGS